MSQQITIELSDEDAQELRDNPHPSDVYYQAIQAALPELFMIDETTRKRLLTVVRYGSSGLNESELRDLVRKLSK